MLRSSLVLGASSALAVIAFIGCSDSPPETDISTTDPPDASAAKDAARSDSSTDPGPTDTVDAGPKDAEVDVYKGPFSCTKDSSFPSLLQLAEASSAAEVELIAGVRELFVLSDSGNNGAALLITLGSGGGSTRKMKLSLDATGGDDVEGIAWRGGKLYTLTSSGAVRRFSPDGAGSLTRDQDSYPIGPDPYACSDLTAVNCGKNYEGLCLRSASITSPCAGYAASKADGKLYCVTVDGLGRLKIDPSAPPISLSIAKDSLSDCAFGTAGGSGEGALVIATNVYNTNKSYRVDEASGTLTELPTQKLLNTEAVAIDRDGALYVFDDNSQALSMAAKTSCQNW